MTTASVTTASGPSSSANASGIVNQRASNSCNDTAAAETIGDQHVLFDTSSSSTGIHRTEQDVDPSMVDAISLHLADLCSPCRFVSTTRGCRYGASCKHCHFEHFPIDTHAWRKRPGKIMRLSFQKYCAKLEDERARDPMNFDASKVEHPGYIEKRASLKRALMKRFDREANATESLNASATSMVEQEEALSPERGVCLFDM
eukprot:CAMPEP_0117526920 /NCGR_PEP_ID=MMETSP0784-20121206/36533_1 /TAXON_ID=39447 /ORGANISM="" /LENGTH=201 /DNA_ID=CAMNT_0005323161 /DNA_START=65 /DNA_END=670 /DNA_ORIENTATION=+